MGPALGWNLGVCPDATFVLTSHPSSGPTDPTVPIPSVLTIAPPGQAAAIPCLIHISSPCQASHNPFCTQKPGGLFTINAQP